MLGPTPCPTHSKPLAKYDVLKQQAHVVGLGNQVKPVPLTSAFHADPNKAGVRMSACTGNGEDLAGRSDGSKNSTLVTYLADAWSWGAEM